ncbi:hypothetical protein KKH3_44560 [Pectobacterium actinidiae]|nr:hypothetical protein KKH3_44560 [Pectobacterium actinidiae]
MMVGVFLWQVPYGYSDGQRDALLKNASGVLYLPEIFYCTVV